MAIRSKQVTINHQIGIIDPLIRLKTMELRMLLSNVKLMEIFMKLAQFYRQYVLLDINLLETSRKLLSHNLNFTFKKVEYGKATL